MNRVSVVLDPEHGIVLKVEPGVLGPDDQGCWVAMGIHEAQRLVGQVSSALIAAGVMRGRERRFVQCQGEKRAYRSRAAARAAHAAAGFRVRIYRCPRCDAFHVANADKGASRA